MDVWSQVYPAPLGAIYTVPDLDRAGYGYLGRRIQLDETWIPLVKVGGCDALD